MNIIALLGSPHGLNGNTGGLLRYVLEGAEGEGARTEVVVLKGDTVLPCLGCDSCHKKGRCVQKDHFESLKEKISGADGLIVASPNYISNVSAQMKAFMDRCCGIIHCMQFWGKYGTSVVTSGGTEGQQVCDLIEHFLITTGTVPIPGAIASMSELPDGRFTHKIKEKAVTTGKRLVASWRAGEVAAGVDERRNAFRRRMQELVEYRKEDWQYEYRHWNETGELKK